MDENLSPITQPTFQESPKRNICLIVLVAVMILAGVLTAGYFWYQTTQSSATSTSNSFEWCMANGGEDKTPNYNAPKVCVLNNKVYKENCAGNNKYFVISKNITDSVETDIVVKYKSSDNQVISCDYLVGSGDFKIKGDAEYILALENNFLITDSGTGPDPRELTIYDLNTRKKIYKDSYSQPIDIKDNAINYWTESSEKATEKNCPELKEWEAGGLGAAIDTHMSLNLTTLTKTELGEYRCSPRQ